MHAGRLGEVGYHRGKLASTVFREPPGYVSVQRGRPWGRLHRVLKTHGRLDSMPNDEKTISILSRTFEWRDILRCSTRRDTSVEAVFNELRLQDVSNGLEWMAAELAERQAGVGELGGSQAARLQTTSRPIGPISGWP